MPDPASMNVSVTINGLHPTEAALVLGTLPAGADFYASVGDDERGGVRYTVTVGELSTVRARNLLHEFINRMNVAKEAASDGTDDQG